MLLLKWDFYRPGPAFMKAGNSNQKERGKIAPVCRQGKLDRPVRLLTNLSRVGMGREAGTQDPPYRQLVYSGLQTSLGRRGSQGPT